ncbi:hypothetical protein Q1695_007048 [Nippostrongylus brasiliensis]|nr:hypothetical protein Q1695_007048 [Nippostrongylus brasiliensis]
MHRKPCWITNTLLLFSLVLAVKSDCPTPPIPDGVLIDNNGPYENGATVNVRCPGNGYILGPSSMTCVFSFWAPPFVGHCSNSQSNSCETPQIPEGTHLSREGPFGMGDTVSLLCNNGTSVLGVSTMSCVFGRWAPDRFGDCLGSRRYSCQVPTASPGLELSTSGTLPHGSSVTATCTAENKVLVGIKSLTCVLGNWAPNHFGDCVDISALGTVVYSNGAGQAIVKFKEKVTVTNIAPNQYVIVFSDGGYGIVDVRTYTGQPDSEGSTWSIDGNTIYRDGSRIQSARFGVILLKGYRLLSSSEGEFWYFFLSNLKWYLIVNISPRNLSLHVGSSISTSTTNGILYINGVPVAEAIGDGSASVSTFNS